MADAFLLTRAKLILNLFKKLDNSPLSIDHAEK